MMFALKFFAKASCYLIVLLLAGLWLKPQAAFSEMPINKVPWDNELASYDVASPYEIKETSTGSVKISFKTVLEGVSPRMLYWFYQHQADKSAKLGDEKHLWYKFSHPLDHSEMVIVESPDQHSDRLMSGTVFYQRELINDHELNVKFRVKSFGEEGMSLDLMHSGYVVGEFIYQFEERNFGTAITLNAHIGLNFPLIGHLSNFYLFNKVYPSFVIQDWVEHMLESFEHQQVLIPKLYSQKSKNEYTLS